VPSWTGRDWFRRHYIMHIIVVDDDDDDDEDVDEKESIMSE
jgi:hypothetical protein